jgi:hypothetical protein
MSVLEHHVLIIRRCLGLSWGDFFVGVLVFVTLIFFEEGIGNNLTMPSGSWVLDLGSWDQGLGVLEESLLISFGLVFVKWVCLEPLVYQSKTPCS